MTEAVVVSFRWSALETPERAVARARAAAVEAAELGGRLAGFGGFEVAFRFDAEEIEAAALFARSVVQRIPSLGRAGMARGAVAAFETADGLNQLAWGEPLVIAAALARLAELGSVLLLEDLAKEFPHALQSGGPGRELPFAGRTRATVKLEALSFEADSAVIEEPHNLSETAQVRVAPVMAPSTFPPAADPPRRSHTGSYEMLELARSALLRSDSVSLDTAVSELNLSAQNKEIVERLAGVLAMTRGANEEGLRVLRRAAETEQTDDKRARAVLAYAIGVAAAGRHEEALLEALSALSITRQSQDPSGERACARFLAQLAFANGHVDAASAWEHVAQRAAD